MYTTASRRPSTTMPVDHRRRENSSAATQTMRSAIRRNSVTGSKTTTSPTISASASGVSSTGEPQSSVSPRATSRPVVTAGHAKRNDVIVAIVLPVVFVLALAVTFKLHHVWRRRSARRRNSTFIQYSFYADAPKARMSVVPRDEPLVPPLRPRDWDARSAAASSTAATFDSPISASEFHHDRNPRAARGMQPSLDEKLRDIFYPAAHADPRSSASFVPSFSSPVSVSVSVSVSAPPISPPPPAARAQLPSFVPDPNVSPQAWREPPPNPGYPAQSSGPRTPRHSGGGDRRPPSYANK